MTTPVFQEWLNQNAYRNYPFREDASLVPEAMPDIKVPDYLLVDFIMTTAGAGAVTVRMNRLIFAGGFITCVFVDTADQVVTTLALNTKTYKPYTAVPLTGQGIYEDARGVAVLGDLSRLPEDLPDGIFQFQDCTLEHCTIRPDLRGVRSVRVGQGDALSDYIRGHIKLIEGNNIRLTYIPDVNGIRIDAIDGAGFNQVCDCEDVYTPPNCISTINGINANNIQIIGDGKCVEVHTEGNRVIISDKCSAPCCGCPELEFITTNLRLQESVLRRVEEYAETLGARLATTVDTILASTKGG